MTKEQCLLLAVRHQLSVLGVEESIIDSNDASIFNFCKLLVQSIELETKQKSVSTVVAPLDPSKYKYYMYINNPQAFPGSESYPEEWLKGYKDSDHGIIFDTFESNSDWTIAVESRDVATMKAIYDEVVKFAKSRPVPQDLVNFIECTPTNITNRNWNALSDYNGIVDAYCDEGEDEYVIYKG
jgi:hypothetical protein